MLNGGQNRFNVELVSIIFIIPYKGHPNGCPPLSRLAALIFISISRFNRYTSPRAVIQVGYGIHLLCAE